MNAERKKQNGPTSLAGRRRNQSGSVMVMALVVLAALVALAATLAANQRARLDAAVNRLRDRRIQMAANSAVQRALATLSTANTSLVTLNDDWAVLGDNGNMKFDLGNGVTFRMQIVDTASLINLNMITQATSTMTQSLTAGTPLYNASLQCQASQLPLSQDEIAGLFDWIHGGQTDSQQGAKDDVYNNLQTPYNTKLGPLTTVSELMLIQGWVGHDVYSTSPATVASQGPLTDANGNTIPLIALITADSGMPNTQASGTNRTSLSGMGTQLSRYGVSASQVATLTGLGTNTTWSTVLRTVAGNTNAETQLLNTASVLPTGTVQTAPTTRLLGRLNINTATASALESIPNMTTDVANAIVAQQATGFTSFGNLATVGGASSILPQIADWLGVGSDTWMVRIFAESGDNGQAYEVLVGIRTIGGQPTPVVLSWDKLPNPGIPTWWEWSAQTDQTVDAGADESQNNANASGSTGSTGSAGGGAAGGR